MRTLEGRTIAVLENRKAGELVAMIERLGGSVFAAPAVRERATLDGAASIIERAIGGDFQIVIALTGAGVSALLAQAERMGSLRALLDAFRAATVACRGPKPLGVLRRHGVTAAVVSAQPHTTAELLDALKPVALHRKTVLLLHYGERNAVVADALRADGAQVEEACLYEWALPDDVEPLRILVRRVIAGQVDAAVFTSQIQFRFLEAIAHELGVHDQFVEALNTSVVVGAVGPVCASALRAGGVVPDVLPASANSASLVGAVADYFASPRWKE